MQQQRALLKAILARVHATELQRASNALLREYLDATLGAMQDAAAAMRKLQEVGDAVASLEDGRPVGGRTDSVMATIASTEILHAQLGAAIASITAPLLEMKVESEHLLATSPAQRKSPSAGQTASRPSERHKKEQPDELLSRSHDNSSDAASASKAKPTNTPKGGSGGDLRESDLNAEIECEKAISYLEKHADKCIVEAMKISSRTPENEMTTVQKLVSRLHATLIFFEEMDPDEKIYGDRMQPILSNIDGALEIWFGFIKKRSTTPEVKEMASALSPVLFNLATNFPLSEATFSRTLKRLEKFDAEGENAISQKPADPTADAIAKVWYKLTKQCESTAQEIDSLPRKTKFERIDKLTSLMHAFFGSVVQKSSEAETYLRQLKLVKIEYAVDVVVRCITCHTLSRAEVNKYARFLEKMDSASVHCPALKESLAGARASLKEFLGRERGRLQGSGNVADLPAGIFDASQARAKIQAAVDEIETWEGGKRVAIKHFDSVLRMARDIIKVQAKGTEFDSPTMSLAQRCLDELRERLPQLKPTSERASRRNSIRNCEKKLL